MTNLSPDALRGLLEMALAKAINFHGIDASLNTPDFILAKQLSRQVAEYLEATIAQRVIDLEAENERLRALVEKLGEALREHTDNVSYHEDCECAGCKRIRKGKAALTDYHAFKAQSEGEK